MREGLGSGHRDNNIRHGEQSFGLPCPPKQQCPPLRRRAHGVAVVVLAVVVVAVVVVVVVVVVVAAHGQQEFLLRLDAAKRCFCGGKPHVRRCYVCGAFRQMSQVLGRGVW